MSHSAKIKKENELKYIKLGLNIAYYRKLSGFTQEELAEACNISRTHLSNIEAPNVVKTISLEMLFDIPQALSIDPYKLLEFRD